MKNSVLPELAQIEIEAVAQVEATRAKCEEHIAEAQRASQVRLTVAPGRLQEERRKSIQAAIADAEQQADSIRADAAEEPERLTRILEQQTEAIVERMLAMILPGHSAAPAGEEVPPR